MPRKIPVRKRKLERHAQQRARSRYGLNGEQFQAIHKHVRQQMRTNQFGAEHGLIVLERQNSDIVFAVYFEDKWIPIVYNRNHKVLVTFLPAEALETELPKPSESAPETEPEAKSESGRLINY